MSRLRQNLLASLAGSGWAALLNFVFIPVYLHYLGVEAYGLVGIFSALMAIMNILDLGLTPTMSREMARYSVDSDKTIPMRNFARTLEAVYWLMATLIGVALWALAPVIAADWVKASHLPPATLQAALFMMAGIAACQWPASFYTGGLQGLQRHVLLNALTAIATTMRFAGAAAILWLISPSIEAFFAWQIFSSAVHSVLLAVAFWASLPSSQEATRIEVKYLFQVGHFAGGMSAVTIATLALTQLDKVILSKILPLHVFGYYALASTVASGLVTVTRPVFASFFPAFSALAARHDEGEISGLYHRGCQWVSVLVVPLGLTLSAFSRELIALWLHDAEMTRNIAPLATLLILGTTLNALMNMPYALQLAHGWTSLTLRMNLAAASLIIPVFLLLVPRFGAMAAAGFWVILNSAYILITIPVMHSRLLPTEHWLWYRDDVGIPLVAAAIPVLVGRVVISEPASPAVALPAIASVGFLSCIGAAFAAPQVRSWVLTRFRAQVAA